MNSMRLTTIPGTQFTCFTEYKSTNTDSLRDRRPLVQKFKYWQYKNSKTDSTSTKVQILTVLLQKFKYSQSAQSQTSLASRSPAPRAQFTCFTSTNVHILTLTRLPDLVCLSLTCLTRLSCCSNSIRSRMLTYAHACSRMLTYAHVCSRMLTYAPTPPAVFPFFLHTSPP